MSRLPARLRGHLDVPLYRNGYALAVAAAATSLSGFVYWIIAARLYPASVVGIGSAVISAMNFLSGIGQLGLTSALARFLPDAGVGGRKLIAVSYAVSVLLSTGLGAIFVAGVDVWAPSLAFLQTDPWWFTCFVLSTGGWTIFTLQDSALAGLRRAVWVTVENVAFSLVRLLLLVVLAGAATPAALFAAASVPAALTLLPVTILIFRVLLPRSAPQASEEVGRGMLLRFVIGNHIGGVMQLATTALLPVLVVERAGAREGAYFVVPWAIGVAMAFVTAGVTTSLTVEGARAVGDLRAQAVRMLTQALVLVAPVALIAVVVGPTVLLMFGSDYADNGAALLRWVGLTAVPDVVFSVGLAVSRVRTRAAVVAVAYGVVAVIVLGLSTVLLSTMGLEGVGVAWFVGQTTGACVFVVAHRDLLLPSRRDAMVTEA